MFTCAIKTEGFGFFVVVSNLLGRIFFLVFYNPLDQDIDFFLGLLSFLSQIERRCPGPANFPLDVFRS